MELPGGGRSGEHRPRGEPEERQSCDYGLHFRCPSFNRKAERPCGTSWPGDGDDELLQNVSREADLKEFKNVPEMVLNVGQEGM
jgi:hypothetical protein